MGRAKRIKPAREEKTPQPCIECGAGGEYSVDAFGIPSETWRCAQCHEQACRRKVRHDMWGRYGYNFGKQ
jgi:hypothetical protein